ATCSAMSRGIGRLQRALLLELRDNETRGERATAQGLDIRTLAALVHYGSPRATTLLEDHELTAVRRALNGLAARRAVINLGRLRQHESSSWRLVPESVLARLAD